MSQQEATQQTIFGEELDRQINIETTGRAIRPWVRMLRQVASEWKFNFDSDGIEVACTGPAHVMGLWTRFSADACETWDVAETTLGVAESALGSTLRHARYGKSTSDAIHLWADKETLETEVKRDVHGHDVMFTERAKLLDSGSIRQEPDKADIELGTEVDIDPQAFSGIVDALDMDGGDTLALKARKNDILFERDSDTYGSQVEVATTPTEPCDATYLSADYVQAIATALTNGYVDSATLRWTEEMPLMVDFEREGYYEGSFMVAPRIKSEP